MSPIDRFMKKVERTSSCWVWVGTCVRSGYGSFYDKKYYPAHRWSYEHFKGPIPSELYVCHSCDNPPCVNPDHLWLGTPLDNYRDAMKKGRIKGTTKLSPDQVVEIKFLRDLGVPRNRVAKMFGVGVGTIESIDDGTTWKWVKV